MTSAELETACRRLLAAYEDEEREHGFPFNFELRAAHRGLAALLPRCATCRDRGFDVVLLPEDAGSDRVPCPDCHGERPA